MGFCKKPNLSQYTHSPFGRGGKGGTWSLPALVKACRMGALLHAFQCVPWAARDCQVQPSTHAIPDWLPSMGKHTSPLLVLQDCVATPQVSMACVPASSG